MFKLGKVEKLFLKISFGFIFIIVKHKNIWSVWVHLLLPMQIKMKVKALGSGHTMSVFVSLWDCCSDVYLPTQTIN